jgi:hypothetical protein
MAIPALVIVWSGMLLASGPIPPIGFYNEYGEYTFCDGVYAHSLKVCRMTLFKSADGLYMDIFCGHPAHGIRLGFATPPFSSNAAPKPVAIVFPQDTMGWLCTRTAFSPQELLHTTSYRVYRDHAAAQKEWYKVDRANRVWRYDRLSPPAQTPPKVRHVDTMSTTSEMNVTLFGQTDEFNVRLPNPSPFLAVFLQPIADGSKFDMLIAGSPGMKADVVFDSQHNIRPYQFKNEYQTYRNIFPTFPNITISMFGNYSSTIKLVEDGNRFQRVYCKMENDYNNLVCQSVYVM